MWCIIAFVALMLFLFVLRGGAECCAELRGKGGRLRGWMKGCDVMFAIFFPGSRL